jgi:hypothetical protein
VFGQILLAKGDLERGLRYAVQALQIDLTGGAGLKRQHSFGLAADSGAGRDSPRAPAPALSCVPPGARRGRPARSRGRPSTSLPPRTRPSGTQSQVVGQ